MGQGAYLSILADALYQQVKQSLGIHRKPHLGVGGLTQVTGKH